MAKTQILTVIFGCAHFWICSSNAEICVSSVCEFTLEIRWGRLMTHRPPDKNYAYNLDLDGDRLRIVNSSYFQVNVTREAILRYLISLQDCNIADFDCVPVSILVQQGTLDCPHAMNGTLQGFTFLEPALPGLNQIECSFKKW